MIDMAKELIAQKLGSSVDSGTVTNALESLFGGDFDIGALVAKVTQNGALNDILGSWLGSGENLSIDPSSIMDIFGESKVADFASTLNMDTESASSLLADVVPNIVDEASNEGGILESVGGMEGALSMASKFF
jgi:uncharacterized protein YidB (DUF937 family)